MESQRAESGELESWRLETGEKRKGWRLTKKPDWEGEGSRVTSLASLSSRATEPLEFMLAGQGKEKGRGKRNQRCIALHCIGGLVLVTDPVGRRTVAKTGTRISLVIINDIGQSSMEMLRSNTRIRCQLTRLSSEHGSHPSKSVSASFAACS